MTTITANVPLLGGVYEIQIKGRKIAAIRPSRKRTDLFAGPTLFDIQVNGYGGETCKIRTPDKKGVLRYITQLFRQVGVGWWVPTVCTGMPDVLTKAFKHLGEALDEDPDVADSIPGFHLEGPYLSREEGPRGVHELKAIRPPSWDEFCRLQDLSGNRIRYITLAAESKGVPAFVRKCVKSGVVVSLGHTNMGREDFERAVDAGATMGTHVGNGAHDKIQRHNNYIWYQLASRKTFASFITDGQHLPRECMFCMLRAKGLDLSVITSDCVNLGGLPAGVYGGVEKLPSGRLVAVGTPNLSGSSSNLLECVETVIRLGGLSHADAWRLASVQPARALHLDRRLGMAPGKEASLTVYRFQARGPRVDVRQTWVAGRLVYEAGVTPRVKIAADSVDMRE